MFQQVSKKALREILSIMYGVSATTHETVKRRPIDLAKLGQCGARNIRFGFGSPGREHYAPMSRRKQVAPTVAIPTAGVHASGFHPDGSTYASHETHLHFVQHTLRNAFVKGDGSSCTTINIQH